jgi:hypothetical protein
MFLRLCWHSYYALQHCYRVWSLGGEACLKGTSKEVVVVDGMLSGK